MLCLKNDLFKRSYIAIYRSDNDCLKCHQSRILFRRSSRLKMTKIVFVLWEDRWRQSEEKRYEMCHEFSLMMKDLIDKHLLMTSWSCMIRFIYDSIFWTIVLSWCFWWIIIQCFRRRIQMKVFFFNQRIFFEYFEYVLIFFWWNFKYFSFSSRW
jgi:hypothetical protein